MSHITWKLITLVPHRLSEEKTLFNLDLAVQLLLKQGQVEIDEGEFIPDYSGSVLVHRKAIEELNKEIKVAIVKLYTLLPLLMICILLDPWRGEVGQHE